MSTGCVCVVGGAAPFYNQKTITLAREQKGTKSVVFSRCKKLGQATESSVFKCQKHPAARLHVWRLLSNSPNIRKEQNKLH